MMVTLAISITILCLTAAIWNVCYFIKHTRPSRWYILGKGLVILYLGVCYGAISIDRWIDIIRYPTDALNPTMQLTRIAALLTASVFVMDAWIRDKL